MVGCYNSRPAKYINVLRHCETVDANLPDHDHCRYCGAAVPFEQAYCCEDCYWKDQEKIKKDRQREALLAAIAVIGAVAILAVSFIL